MKNLISTILSYGIIAFYSFFNIEDFNTLIFWDKFIVLLLLYITIRMTIGFKEND